MTRNTSKIIRSLAPALVVAALGASTGEQRSPDELDAARSLPPEQLAAVAEGMRSHSKSGDCAGEHRSAR